MRFDEPNAHLIVSVARREEKGFDINVAAHLLGDVLRGQPGQQPIQAAVIISNDSDIKLPIDSMDTLHRSPPVAVLCQRIAFHRPTGQCSIVMSSMGKSVGLPVAK